jgi:hypothetical protein
LNMVRASVVDHPSQWTHSGYTAFFPTAQVPERPPYHWR